MHTVIGVLILIVLLALVKTFFDMIMRSSFPVARTISPRDRIIAVDKVPYRGPASSEIYGMERKMLDLINRERASHRLESLFARPLKWDEVAASVARTHSTDMARRGYIAHINPEGIDPAGRLQIGGVNFTMAGENVAKGFANPEAAMKAFMDEPRFQQNHRANILNRRFTYVGVGIVRDKGGLSITQNFIRR